MYESFLPWLLALATFAAYHPVWHAGFIWDDDSYVTMNTTLRDVGGLWRIWFEVGAVPQYYPLVHTVFWLEYHLWGLNPLGYHLVNLCIHVAAALLLRRVLLRWRVPGADLAAFVFALHPVGVESVAWVTELKNVMSAAFYFAAALAYRRFTDGRDVSGGGGAGGEDRGRSWGWYAAALLLFSAALFSKTVTLSLPAALLLLRWWERGRLDVADGVPLIPFAALGAVLGWQTAWIEKHNLGATGANWSLTFAESCLVAGRALWFYAAKLLLPVHLSFVYPRWTIDTSAWWQWLFPLAAVAVAAALWRLRVRFGRGPLVAVLYFAGTLGPALGFVNVYPMRYAFVADHFQYLAGVGLMALAAGLLEQRLGAVTAELRNPRGLVPVAWLVVLGVATWNRAWVFTDLETLWRQTLERNPSCSIAHNNLGNLLTAAGRGDEAFEHYRLAVEGDPINAEARNSLAFALLGRGRIDESIVHLQAALRSQPGLALTHFNLGWAFEKKGEPETAIEQFRRAVALQPRFASARSSLGVALLESRRLDEAVVELRAAVELEPGNADLRNNLGTALLRARRVGEAATQYEAAVALRPGFTDAYDNLRSAAWYLATLPEAADRNGPKALEVARLLDELTGRANPAVAATLAAAYAETGGFEEAEAAVERALQLSRGRYPDLVAGFEAQLEEYRASRAHREAPPDIIAPRAP